MTFIHRLLLLSVFVLTALAGASAVQASDFDAAYSVDYTLLPELELTHIKQQVSLTNKQSNLRASSYSFTLDSDKYQNLKAYDSGGRMAFREEAKDGRTAITFTFNDRVVGVGNTLRWTIEYDSPTLAQRHGQIWDVAIPRVEEHESYTITSYKARLLIPKSAGDAHYISPQASSTTEDDNYRIYAFNREQIFPAGIVAAFGSEQVFSFTLKYHLHNPNIGQASTEIALPPDIPRQQQIVYQELQPKPVSIRTDADGNSLATYYLGPNKSLDVTFTGWAKIDAHYPNLASARTAKDIPSQLVQTYTVGQKYWEVGDAELVKKVEEITDPAKPVAENVRAIYNYVTSTLQYNTARINKDLQRMGASAAYRDPKNAVCMEFTDLFVTMARIAGIPAREVDGYAYTSDSDNQPIFYPGLGSDILHAWAQVYLPDDGWVMVDPTWGSTTGGIDFLGRVDLNRIAFAIKGVSSLSPYAAGSYKTNDQQDGDVSVKFSDEKISGKGGLELAMDRDEIIAGIGSSLPLKIKNNGNVALYNLNVNIRHDKPLLISDDFNPNIEAILPGQTVTVWLPMESEGWFDQAQSTLGVTVKTLGFDEEVISADKDFKVTVQPFFTSVVAPILALIFGVLGIIAASWFLLHKLHHKTQPLPPNALSDQPLTK
jgi:transglutaminase-like putative cysteine protease